MKAVRKIDQKFFDDQSAMRIYAIAVCPNWEHWHAKKCPRPIRELIASKYPDASIERVCGWKGKANFAPGSEEIIELADLPQPVFRIGLADHQAEAFGHDLEVLSPHDVGEDFYFLTIDRKPHPACLSGEELLAEFDLNEVDLSGLQSSSD